MPDQPAALSNVTNVTPGRSPTSLRSSLPITHVSATSGHACCSVRTSGTTWVTSPMAEVRSRQIEAGVVGVGVMGLG